MSSHDISLERLKEILVEERLEQRRWECTRDDRSNPFDKPTREGILALEAQRRQEDSAKSDADKEVSDQSQTRPAKSDTDEQVSDKSQTRPAKSDADEQVSDIPHTRPAKKSEDSFNVRSNAAVR